MNYRLEFERMMGMQTEIALATSVNGQPNIRIVNFYYECDQKVIYFSSFADNQKVSEFEQNPNVAFTTIPKNGEEHVRVKNSILQKSTVAVEEIKDKFLTKMPEYIMSIPNVIPALVLFEITFEEADVVLDFEHMDTISL